MDRPAHAATAATIVVVGLLALASAMGVGRFAFTPLLPLMQAHDGLSLGQGAWLATANYLGYAAGALACSVRPPAPHAAARAGLIAVAVSTLAMGVAEGYPAWLVLRFVAGVASACVLVGVSGWALAALGARGRAGWSGGVFSGVGIGIALAGVAGLVAGIEAVAPATVWLLLGAASAAVAAIGWLPLSADATAAPAKAAALRRWSPGDARLVAGYGAFGFGYIIPATFLPAMAKQAIADPVAFGLVWPVYGAAAAASTMLAGAARRRWGDRNVWAASHLLMAAGVAVLLVPGIAPALAMMASALLVGGTFMVATMAGLQEARRLAGAGARTLIAAMTTAFATGQIAGPLVVGVLGDAAASLVAAVILLVATAFALRRIP